LASVQAVTGSTSADIPVVAASPLLAVDSLTAFSASLNLVVDFSSYLLQQDTSLPPSSPASPPLISHHPMVLKSRQPKTANLVALLSLIQLPPPSSQPLAFSNADRYAIWHDAMCDEIKVLRSNL
jgi:hypothetical protein